MSNGKKFQLQGVSNWVSLLVLLIIATLWWWPTRNLPYHWDSAGFVINATRDLVERNFQPWVVEFSDFAHPPLLMTFLGIAWNIWGMNPIVSHLLMWPFLPILMWATYELTKMILPDSEYSNLWKEMIGIAGGVLVGSLPFVLAEYGMIYVDLPAGALASAGIVFLVKKRFFWSGFFLTLGVMSKESVLLLLPAVILLASRQVSQSWLWQWNKQDWENLIKKKNWRLLWLFLPLISWLIWMMYHYLVTDWWLIREERATRTAGSALQWWRSLVYILQTLLFEQGRWLLTVPAIGGLLNLSSSKRKREHLMSAIPLSLWGGLLLGIGVYAYMGEFGMRYGIFLLPLWVALSIWLSHWAIDGLGLPEKYRTWLLLGFVLVGIGGSVSNWKTYEGISNKFDVSPPNNLEYQDHIRLGQEVADYLAINYPDAIIYGSFPEIYQLTQPWQGYVWEPLRFQECKDFEFNNEEFQILYLHAFSPGQLDCQLISETYLIDDLPKYQFVVGDKWTELYEITEIKPIGEPPNPNLRNEK